MYMHACSRVCTRTYTPRHTQLRLHHHCLRPTADLLRENKRNLDKAIRDLDRERMGLQNQEKRIIADIKKMAKEGQMVCGRRRGVGGGVARGRPGTM